MYPPQNKYRLNLALLVAGILLTLLCVFQIVQAIKVYDSTGLLKIASSDNNAVLSVSQTNSQASIVGTGSGTVRLNPGPYLVSASDAGYQIYKTVNISSKSVYNLKLSFPVSPKPSAAKLFSQLPFLGPASEYQISYSTETDGEFTGPVLIISAASDQARQDALEWIRSQGYNPSDYKIEYKVQRLTNYHYTNGMP